MLELALQVVEAARALKLERKGNISGSAITSRFDLAVVIDALREAIEEFDRQTGNGMDAPALTIRPEFATPPQINDETYDERMEQIIERGSTPEMDHTPEHHDHVADLGPNKLPTPSLRPDYAEMRDIHAFRPALSITAGSTAEAMEYLRSLDANNVEFNDGTESVGDLLQSLDIIEDRLEYAVSKIGWTPKLRALAQASRIARNKMILDVCEDGVFVRVPADSWASLTESVADAVSHMTPKIERREDIEEDYSNHPQRPLPAFKM